MRFVFEWDTEKWDWEAFVQVEDGVEVSIPSKAAFQHVLERMEEWNELSPA